MTESRDSALERASEAVGRRIESTAEAIRRGGSPDGFVGTTVNGVATRLQHGADYLRRTTPGGIVADVEDLLRRRPLRTAVIAIAAAFVLSRRFAPRASGR